MLHQFSLAIQLVPDGVGVKNDKVEIGIFKENADAARAVRGKGPFEGDDGEVELVDVVEGKDGQFYRVSDPTPIVFGNLPEIKKAARASALAKLEPAEIEALGIELLSDERRAKEAKED